MSLCRKSSVTAILVIAIALCVHYLLFGPQGVVMDPSPINRLDATGKPRHELWAFVSGGTSGVGQSFAADLLHRGFSVVISGTSDKTVQAGIAALEPHKSNGLQKVDGVVLDVTQVDNAKAVLEDLLARKDVRVVVYSAFPERFRPIYAANSTMIRFLISGMAVSLAEALAVTTRHWMQTNKTAVFIGGSAVSAHADIVAGELYTSLRTFQSKFLYRNAEMFLSKTSGYADDQTRQILISVAEIPIVNTPLLRKAMSRNSAIIKRLQFMMWDCDDYVRRVLDRVLNKGHSFIVEGWGWRIRRALSNIYPFNFGEHSAEAVQALRQWS